MANTCGFLLCLALFFVSVCGDCTLLIGDNDPIIIKSFGTKTITKKQHKNVVLNEGEIVGIYCPTGFKQISRGDENNVRGKFRCKKNSYVEYKLEAQHGFEDLNPYEPFRISCRDGPVQILYESETALPNCEKNMSYAIGIEPSPLNPIITAGICFDLDSLQLKYVKYVAQERKTDIFSNKTSLQEISLDKKISNAETFFSFLSPATFKELYNGKKINQPLLELFDFDYTSLIRDTALNAELVGNEYIFNTIWWRNLRLGNWQFYQDALEERTKTINYMVNMGTSGVITIPKVSCNSSKILSVEQSEISVKAPMYIWAHLKSMKANVSDDFVVIGNNSPFNPISNATSFCIDICDEIEWLKKSVFNKVRLLPAMGVVICCRPEDVAEKLDNFPYTPTSTTTIEPEVEVVEGQTLPNII